MAMNKSKKSLPCFAHVLLYTACFLLLTTSWKALLVIGGTHFVLDRFPVIVRRILYFKNSFLRISYPHYKYCDTTGYFDDSPYNTKKVKPDDWSPYGQPRHFFITIWLYIITDNLFHLTINYFALKYL
jgi:hypothetical protein